MFPLKYLESQNEKKSETTHTVPAIRIKELRNISSISSALFVTNVKTTGNLFEQPVRDNYSMACLNGWGYITVFNRRASFSGKR